MPLTNDFKRFAYIYGEKAYEGQDVMLSLNGEWGKRERFIYLFICMLDLYPVFYMDLKVGHTIFPNTCWTDWTESE